MVILAKWPKILVIFDKEENSKFLIKFKRYLNELFLNIQMSLCCGASKSCSMIGLSLEDFDLFE